MPSPRPTGMRGPIAAGLSSARFGRHRRASPIPSEKSDQGRPPLAAVIDQPAAERSGGADQRRHDHENGRGAQCRVAGSVLQILLAEIERADHHRERERGHHRCRNDHVVEDRTRTAGLALVKGSRKVANDSESREQGERHECPPVRAPAQQDGQHAAEHRTEKIREARACAPHPECRPASLGREAADRARERGRAHQPGSGALDGARCRQQEKARGKRSGSGPDREHGEPEQRDATRTEPIDEGTSG